MCSCKNCMCSVCGCLISGDEVLQWNGKLLPGATMKEVYNIILESQSEPQVELMVSRPIGWVRKEMQLLHCQDACLTLVWPASWEQRNFNFYPLKDKNLHTHLDSDHHTAAPLCCQRFTVFIFSRVPITFICRISFYWLLTQLNIVLPNIIQLQTCIGVLYLICWF